jgi:hypothetical protein
MQDKINYISPETFQRVQDYIPQLGIRKWNDHDIVMLLRILYFCALRPSEGIYLKKENFNLYDREKLKQKRLTMLTYHISLLMNLITGYPPKITADCLKD